MKSANKTEDNEEFDAIEAAAEAAASGIDRFEGTAKNATLARKNAKRRDDSGMVTNTFFSVCFFFFCP